MEQTHCGTEEITRSRERHNPWAQRPLWAGDSGCWLFTRTIQAGTGQQQRPRKEQEPPNRQECKGDVTAGTPGIGEAKIWGQGTGAQMRKGDWRASKRPRDPVPATRAVSAVSSLPRRMQVQMAYRGSGTHSGPLGTQRLKRGNPLPYFMSWDSPDVCGHGRRGRQHGADRPGPKGQEHSQVRSLSEKAKVAQNGCDLSPQPMGKGPVITWLSLCQNPPSVRDSDAFVNKERRRVV